MAETLHKPVIRWVRGDPIGASRLNVRDDRLNQLARVVNAFDESSGPFKHFDQAIKTVYVVGVATTFSCRDFDANGVPTGDPFTVHARTYPVGAALSLCGPDIRVGDQLDVFTVSNIRLGESWISGYLAVPVFEVRKDCT